jgi:hypothetical protein
MKTKLRLMLGISVLAIVALASGCERAAGLGGGERYKVLSSQGQDAGLMEQQLNSLATEGWTVRAATSQGFIILVK